MGTVSGILLVALFALHPVLDSFLDPVAQTVREPQVFYRWHNAYLWSSTVQWALGLVNAWVTLGVWRGSGS